MVPTWLTFRAARTACKTTPMILGEKVEVFLGEVGVDRAKDTKQDSSHRDKYQSCQTLQMGTEGTVQLHYLGLGIYPFSVWFAAHLELR